MKNKVLFLFIFISVNFIFCQTRSTTTVFTDANVYVKNPPILLVDNFDDGTPPNELGAGYGAFGSNGGGASILHTSTVTYGSSGCSLEITYNVNTSGSYSGLWMKFSNTGGINLSMYKYLSFYVRGLQGGELFKVELKDGTKTAKVYITEYLDGGVTTEWKKVVIPLDNFVNIQNWNNITEFTIVFEEAQSTQNGSPKSSKIYIDNITFGEQFQGVCRVAHFGHKFNIAALGGNFGVTEGNSNTHSYDFDSSNYSGFPYGLKFWTTNYSSNWGGIYIIVGDGWTKVSKNFSNYDRFTFYVKATVNINNNGSNGCKVEFKRNNSSIHQVLYNVSTNWQKITINLPSDKTYDEIVFVVDDWYVGQNYTIWWDRIQFENSSYTADTTSPTAPSGLKLMDTASGRYVVSGTSFSWVNYLVVKASSSIEDPTMECVRFEYSTDGTNWVAFAYDYDTSDNIYCAFWDTSELAEGSNYYLRCVAVDTSGNKGIMSPISGIQIKKYPDISSMSDDELLDFIQKQMFWYFFVEINPNKGLVQDRARNFVQDSYGYTSVAATGLGLVAICIAHSRGWLSFQDAYDRVYKTLKSFYDAPESTSPYQLVHHNGFYYHWTDFGGARLGNCEFSTIDTALFVAGALFAGKYFLQYGYITPWDFADQIYKRVNWNWMRNNNNYLDWGWTPEGGFDKGEINGYSEGILAYILGLGSPETDKKLPNTNGWNSLMRPTTYYEGVSYVIDAAATNPLFLHQFTQMFIDFSKKKDSYTCYDKNSFLAHVHNHNLFYDNYGSQYGKNIFGISATDGVNSVYQNFGTGKSTSTVCISSLLTSIMYSSNVVINAIRELYNYNNKTLWGKYGFPDSYNKISNWKNPDVIGVQLGAAFIGIENARSGLVRNIFTSIPYIQNAFNTIGMTTDTTSPAKITDLVASVNGNNIILTWTTSGNNGSEGDINGGVYEIRFSTNSSDSWFTAPINYVNYELIWSTNVVAGSRHTKTIPSLPSGYTYYFWIRLCDEHFNWNEISNKAQVTK